MNTTFTSNPGPSTRSRTRNTPLHALRFHPDRFSFGQTVFLSPLYAAAHAVPHEVARPLHVGLLTVEVPEDVDPGLISIPKDPSIIPIDDPEPI